MKRHVKHIAAGGVAAPTTLGLVVAIANETQTLLGLHLQGVGLAIYVAAFLVAAAAIVHGQLRLEAQRLLSELGSGDFDLGALLNSLGPLGDLFGGGSQESPGTSTPPGPPPPPLPPVPPTTPTP